MDNDIIINTDEVKLEIDKETLRWLRDKVLSREMKSKGIIPPVEFIRDDLLHHYDDERGYWYKFEGNIAAFGNHNDGYLYPEGEGGKSLIDTISVTPFPIAVDEWNNAELAPKCIVDGYIYADVRLLVGSGGVGKTTLMLFEVAHIALGIPLYGNDIRTPGNVIIVTAEDQRGRLIARLRKVTGELANGTQDMISKVMRSVFILDVTSEIKRLTRIENDVVVIDDAIVGGMIASFRALNPSLVIFDPAVSFGVGEARVNDAEQGLIMAARRMVKGLDCCVTFIHHTGKENASNSGSTNNEVFKVVQNQYAFRGGSAFADGARMVHILGSPTLNEFKKYTDGKIKLSPFFEIDAKPGLFLGLAKMTYAKPKHPVIALARDGFKFHQVSMKGALTPEETNSKILEFLEREVDKGEKHSISSLKDALHKRGNLNTSFTAIETLIKGLIDSGEIEEAPLEKAVGVKKTFLKKVIHRLNKWG